LDPVAVLAAQELERPVEARVQVGRLSPVLRRAGEGGELADDERGPRRSLAADVGVLRERVQALRAGGVGGPVESLPQVEGRGVDEIDARVDERHGVVDLVSDARYQATEGRELVGAREV